MQNQKTQKKQMNKINNLVHELRRLRVTVFEEVMKMNLTHDDSNDEYITATYDEISVCDRVYFEMSWNNRIDIGQYPFTEFREKGAHHDPLGGWFTNPQNKKLIEEYPSTYKLMDYEIKEKEQFEVRRNEFLKKLFDTNTRIVYV
jgi:hypothetical protein